MHCNRCAVLAVPIALAVLAPLAAGADTAWQKPKAQQCELAPGAECNLEVSCPAEMPYVAAGGGGMPAAEPANHSVAMTMNLPISKETWRVRWKNLATDESAKVKVAVRIKCSDSAAEAGWR